MSQRNCYCRRVFLALSFTAALVLTGAAASLAQEPTSGSQPGPVFGQEPTAATPSTSQGFGQEPTPVTATQPQQLVQSDPGFLVRADVNRATRSYREGDALSITVASEVDAYLYVLYRQADGQVFQVFPNSTSPDNRVKARQAVQIPGKDDLFRWVVGPPFGKETIKVLASKEPITELADPAMREKFFNPLATAKLKGIQLELGNQSRAWAEDSVEINTYAATDTQESRGARRFGLFVGLGQYEYIVRTQQGADGKDVTVYQPSHRDARLLAGVLEEVGQLSGARILTNDGATRTNVEEAMTQWLPSVSRPGDTVIVFFSGMAMPIARATGAQDSGIVLPLFEFMTANTVENLRKQRTEGKITTSHSKQLQYAEELFAQGGTAAIVRRWGITDDLFASWLQRLAGRQVIVVLDVPYASSFAPQGDQSASPLSGSVSRLGSLGHQEIALLGACGEERFDVLRDPQGLSLMTELLIQALHESTGPLSIDDAHRAIASSMEARLAEINQSLQASGKEPVSYRPYLVNRCSGAAMLKP